MRKAGTTLSRSRQRRFAAFKPSADTRLARTMTRSMDAFSLRPREVFEELRRTVVGQDDAIREIAVALVKHLVGHPAPNILLIGNSGSGKTTLMRSVESFLASKPELRSHFANVVRINANVLAEEHSGYGKAVLGRLYANARRFLGESATHEELLQS